MVNNKRFPDPSRPTPAERIARKAQNTGSLSKRASIDSRPDGVVEGLVRTLNICIRTRVLNRAPSSIQKALAVRVSYKTSLTGTMNRFRGKNRRPVSIFHCFGWTAIPFASVDNQR